MYVVDRSGVVSILRLLRGAAGGRPIVPMPESGLQEGILPSMSRSESSASEV